MKERLCRYGCVFYDIFYDIVKICFIGLEEAYADESVVIYPDRLGDAMLPAEVNNPLCSFLGNF